MKLSAIKPITYLKTHTSELVEEVIDSRSPVVITRNGEATVVVLDIRSYERMRDHILLSRMISKADTELNGGKGISQEAVEREMRGRFKT